MTDKEYGELELSRLAQPADLSERRGKRIAELEAQVQTLTDALRWLREFHSEKQFDSGVVRNVYDWIDSGMVGTCPEPDSPFFQYWRKRDLRRKYATGLEAADLEGIIDE